MRRALIDWPLGKSKIRFRCFAISMLWVSRMGPSAVANREIDYVGAGANRRARAMLPVEILPLTDLHTWPSPILVYQFAARSFDSAAQSVVIGALMRYDFG